MGTFASGYLCCVFVNEVIASQSLQRTKPNALSLNWRRQSVTTVGLYVIKLGYKNIGHSSQIIDLMAGLPYLSLPNISLYLMLSMRQASTDDRSKM